jgi:NodT family efflux transporter outer membrane factor (OMF) lipoprotein
MPHYCSRALLAATTLLLCSCIADSPARESGKVAGVAVPASWSNAGTAAATGEPPLAQWWERFNDPVLNTLVTQALRDSTEVKSAAAALAQATALRSAAAAALWPTLDGTASAQHGTAGGQSTGSNIQLGVDGAWVLDVFGANRSALRASRASLQASAASLDYTRIAVAAEVGESYILLRSAQARAQIAGDNLASQQETLQITQWRQQAGLVTELETAQATSAAEQTRALLAGAQIAIEQTRHALAVLTGQPPAALDELLSIVSPVPHAPDAELRIPLDTLRQRADVRVAERQVAVAMAQLSQARAARWPGFALSGSLSLDAANASSLTDSASLVSSLLASIRLPLFDAGARRAQVRAHQAALEQARAAYESTVLAALRDVEDGIAALRGDRVRLQSLDNAAGAATSAAALARQRYGSGLVDFQVVLDTQRTRLATQDSLVSASADVGGDQVRLFKALGGGWRDGNAGTLQP